MPTTFRIALLAGALALLANLVVIGFIYFRTHDEAEQAVRLLRSAGVPLQCISIISSNPLGARLGADRAVRLRRQAIR